MATKKKIAQSKRGTKHVRATAATTSRRAKNAPGLRVLREERSTALAEGLVAECRARGIQDDGIAFLLTMEADRIMKAASALVPPPAKEPEAAPLSSKQSELARKIIAAVGQSFETGEEIPGERPRVAILREALRAAKDDLALLAAAQRQLENVDSATRAFIRAEHRIDLALALHAFLTAEDEPASETVSRAAVLRTRLVCRFVRAIFFFVMRLTPRGQGVGC